MFYLQSMTVSSVQSSSSKVHRPGSRFQRPESSVQSPSSRVQCPESSVQNPAPRVQHLRPESRNSGMSFLQNTSEQHLLFSFIKLRYLLTGQQKIDLRYIKSSFQVYQLSLLNKKLIEVFVYFLNWFKTNEKMGSSHQGFYLNASFFKTGVIKPGELFNRVAEIITNDY